MSQDQFKNLMLSRVAVTKLSRKITRCEKRMNMNRILVGLLVVMMCTVSLSWGGEITSFTTSLLGTSPHFPGTPLGLVLEPAVYTVNDGSSSNSGAGSFAGGSADVTKISMVAGLVQYDLSPNTTSIPWLPQLGSDLFMFQDFGWGSTSAEGAFGAVGPLILQAPIGSATATLSGFVRLDANPPSGAPGFEYFAVPVGSLAKFTETFTLQTGGWDTNTFNTTFDYAVSGQVDFTPTPEPGTLCLLGSGVVGIVGVMRRK